MWISGFFKELRTWFVVKSVYDANKKEFLAHGVRRNWFGKLYTVINRKPDIDLGSDEDEAYLHNELAIIWAIMVKHNIADILAYELTPLDSEVSLEDGSVEYEHGYLVVFTPAWDLSTQYVTPRSIVGVTLSFLALLYLGYKLISNIYI